MDMYSFAVDNGSMVDHMKSLIKVGKPYFEEMTQEQAFLCRTELVIFQAHTCSLQRSF
jgi:hypothetical protein